MGFSGQWGAGVMHSASTMPIIGKTCVEIQIQGHKLDVPCYVSEKLNHGLILET